MISFYNGTLIVRKPCIMDMSFGINISMKLVLGIYTFMICCQDICYSGQSVLDMELYGLTRFHYTGMMSNLLRCSSVHCVLETVEFSDYYYNAFSVM